MTMVEGFSWSNGLDSVKGNQEVEKEHIDSRAPVIQVGESKVEEVNDSTINTNLRLIGKLERIPRPLHLWTHELQAQSLQGLDHMGGQGDRPIIIDLWRASLLRHGDNARCLPQGGDPAWCLLGIGLEQVDGSVHSGGAVYTVVE